MPKKGTKSAGGGGGGSSSNSSGKKKPPAPPPDDGFIVFSNSDKDPKPKKAKPVDATTGHDGPGLAGEAPRIDVKTLIGGPSWTGKLPVNILSEHCRKQKWEQPEYTRVWLGIFLTRHCIAESVFR